MYLKCDDFRRAALMRVFGYHHDSDNPLRYVTHAALF